MINIRQTFADEGIVFPVRVLDEAEARAAAARFYVFQARAKAVFGSEIHVKAHLVAPWVMDIVRRPALLDAIESLIGPNVLLWSSDFFNKRAGSGKHVGFHQDSPYWGLAPVDGVVSAWIALTPSLKANGCMQVAKRSHDKGTLEHRKTHDPKSLLSVGQEVAYDFGPDDITDVELRPGEMSLHHLDLVHGGQPNASANDRIGLVLRFVNPETRQIKPPDSAFLLRGEDTHGHFEQESAPETELGDWEMAALRRVFAEMPSGFGGQLVA